MRPEKRQRRETSLKMLGPLNLILKRGGVICLLEDAVAAIGEVPDRPWWERNNFYSWAYRRHESNCRKAGVSTEIARHQARAVGQEIASLFDQ